MAMLHSVADFISWLGWYLVPFLLIMNGIVFFHELGHYLVGRWCGVKIDAFSLGFGPELFAYIDKHGTRWVVTVGMLLLAASYLMLWEGERAHLLFAVHIAILIAGVLLLDMGAQMAQVANQTRIFGLDASARSRIGLN